MGRIGRMMALKELFCRWVSSGRSQIGFWDRCGVEDI